MPARTLSVLVLLLAVVAILLTPDLAWASPIQHITTVFDDAINLFLKRIIPGLCIAIVAWSGVMIAMGRKNLMDSLPVLGGAVIAMTASLIVGYMGKFGG